MEFPTGLYTCRERKNVSFGLLLGTTTAVLLVYKALPKIERAYLRAAHQLSELFHQCSSSRLARWISADYFGCSASHRIKDLSELFTKKRK